MRNRVSGFFQSNSPLVTVAVPLALLMLGLLFWRDRANYAELKSGGAVGIPNEHQFQESNLNVDPENKDAVAEIDSVLRSSFKEK